MEVTTSEDKELHSFLPKLDKVLVLLQNVSTNPKASFSENVTCLLDKALDHVAKLTNAENAKASVKKKKDLHSLLIAHPTVNRFLNETFRISIAPVVHPPIMTFAIKLVALLSCSEAKFLKFRIECSDVFVKLRQLQETTVVENDEVKHALLTLSLTLSKFQAGQEWLVNSGSFIFILSCLDDRAIFTRKTSKEVIIQVIPNLPDERDKEIINCLLKPFEDVNSTFGNHQLLNDQLEPYVEVLEIYIERCLSSSIKPSKNHLKHFGIEEKLLKLVRSINNEKLATNCGILLVGFYAKCALDEPNQRQHYEAETYKLFQLLLSRGFLRSALSVIAQGLYSWSHVGAAKDFQFQLIYLMLVPVLMETEDAVLYFSCYPDYIEKLQTIPNEATSIIADNLKAVLQVNPELNELTSIIVAGFRKTMDKLGKDQALKITRAGLYLMGCFKNPQSRRLTQLSFSSQLAIHLTTSICSFIDIYNIRWWESVETICLPLILTRLVEFSASRNARVTCAALRGLKFCIQQFIHPDQALLVNSTADSTMNDAAKAVDRCLLSIHWEVRDSALEVVREMAQLSQRKYPDFQNLLVRSGLLKSSISAIQDMEPYVRASAVSVLAAACPVPSLWQHMNTDFNVAACCFSILQNDSEALARRSAAKAVTLAAQAGHFPITCDRSLLYRMMSSAALRDLDWEVKLEALHFWEGIFKEVLTNQGMIDGHFPEYTFSQEKQKIIRLDPKEIRRRLQQSLATLGSCGYLHVLLQSADDCDAPVREKALNLLRDIRDLLALHQALDLTIWPEVATPSNEPTIAKAIEQPSNKTSNGTVDADRIIEEILDQDDLVLVNEIMSKDQPVRIKDDPAAVKSVTPTDFVTQINVMELETRLEWASLSSDLHILDLDCLADDLQDCISTSDSRPQPDCY